MNVVEFGFARIAACLLATLVGACAGTQRDASLPIDDPYERTNRRVLDANQAVLRPVAQVVKTVVPKPVHNRLRDLDNNLREPRIFANNILQGRFRAASQTFGRFLANSTFGLGGLFDIATDAGLPQQSGDFGQTLFVWGVGAGPYLVRPYFGPSSVRDSIGSAVDMVSDPVGLLLSGRFGMAATLGGNGLDATVRLGELKQAEDSSIDFYSFLRSSYYQTRRAELREAIGQGGNIDSPATAPGR